MLSHGKEIKDLQSLSTTLLSKGVYCHQFILNVNSTIITMVNNIPYVLLLVYINDNRLISFDDLIWFTNIDNLPVVESLKGIIGFPCGLKN